MSVPPGHRIEELSNAEGASTPSSSSTNSWDGIPEGSDTAPHADLGARLQAAREENLRLEQQRELADLDARNRELATSGSASHPETVIVPEVKAHSFVLRPEKMRPYKGLSEGEHLRWFRDVEIKFLMSPEYFTTEQVQILYCMDSLEDDPNAQWYSWFKNRGNLNGVSFGFFKQFLLNLVSDPASRRLLAYEKWEEARQRPDQKVTNFKAYLEELEAHLPLFSEEHKSYFFLAKLRRELKNKILSTGNVSTQREEIFAQAIMQEKTLERARPNSDATSSSKPQPAGRPQSKLNSNKPENRAPRPKPQQDDLAKFPRARNRGAKRKAGSDDVTCFHCGKPGHIRPNCPDHDKPQTYNVAAVASKKDQASQPPQKRGRRNDQ